jgi:hypothetical protein
MGAKQRLSTNDPAFPHGLFKGYRWGCRGKNCPATPDCKTVASRRRKMEVARKAGVVGPGANSRVCADAVVAHVRSLMAVPEATPRLLSEMCNVSRRTIHSLDSGQRRTTTHQTAARLLAVTREQVERKARAALPLPVTRKTIQLVCSMQAQGFSFGWQGERLGRSANWLSELTCGRCTMISAQMGDKIERLARSVEMEFGPNAQSAGKARRAGWHGLLAYDEHGELIPGAVRDASNAEAQRRKEERNRLAERRIQILRLSLECRWTVRMIADKFDIHDRAVERCRDEAGLKFYFDGLGNSLPRPQCADRVRQIRQALRDYFQVYPTQDPFEMLRGLGMMSSRRFDVDPEDRGLLPKAFDQVEPPVATADAVDMGGFDIPMAS